MPWETAARRLADLSYGPRHRICRQCFPRTPGQLNITQGMNLPGKLTDNPFKVHMLLPVAAAEPRMLKAFNRIPTWFHPRGNVVLARHPSAAVLTHLGAALSLLYKIRKLRHTRKGGVSDSICASWSEPSLKRRPTGLVNTRCSAFGYDPQWFADPTGPSPGCGRIPQSAFRLERPTDSWKQSSLNNQSCVDSLRDDLSDSLRGRKRSAHDW